MGPGMGPLVACLKVTSRGVQSGATAKNLGPIVYPIGSVFDTGDRQTRARFLIWQVTSWDHVGWDLMSHNRPPSNVAASAGRSAFLDTQNPLCYGHHVLGDSAPGGAKLFGWAKASTPRLNWDSNELHEARTQQTPNSMRQGRTLNAIDFGARVRGGPRTCNVNPFRSIPINNTT